MHGHPLHRGSMLPLAGIAPVGAAGGIERCIRVGGAGACRIHPANANAFIIDLRANTTLSIAPSADAAGVGSLTLILVQDATGSRTVTWPSSVDWGSLGAPTLTTTASKADVVTLMSVNGGRSWYGFLSAKGFAAP